MRIGKVFQKIDVRSSMHSTKNTPFKNVYLSLEMHIQGYCIYLGTGTVRQHLETDHFYFTHTHNGTMAYIHT